MAKVGEFVTVDWDGWVDSIISSLKPFDADEDGCIVVDKEVLGISIRTALLQAFELGRGVKG